MPIDPQTLAARQRARTLWQVGCAALVLAFLALAVGGFSVYSYWSESRRNAQLAASDGAFQEDLSQILEDLKDAETSQRGFVLTGRERYLDTYNRVLQPIAHSLENLSRIAGQRPDQAVAIRLIQSQARTKLNELKITIDLRRTRGFDAALAEVLSDRGKNAMDGVRLLSKKVSDALAADAVQRSSLAASHQRMATAIAAGGGALLFLLLVAAFFILTSGARQQAELAEHLAESREMFETMLTSIGDGVIATDTAGHLTFINPQASTITGWPRNEALGKPLNQIFVAVNESTRLPVESIFDKVMRSGDIIGLANHTILIRKDGSEVPTDDSGAPIRNADGKVSGVVLVFRDISERRQAEESLAHSHDQVLKANEELRQFSYAATHDLQEPLRTISVFSQMLNRQYKANLDERGQHLLQTIEDAARRMSALIDSLLVYTRAGYAASPPALVAVNASEILTETISQLHGSIEESGARITCEQLPLVWSDAAQLSHVFQNLLSNAIKYRKPDVAPLIHISSAIEGDHATFRVADNGRGFKQDHADRIFLLFQRLHGRDIPGTGIGLALCRRIVERHGGRIWARSEENIGTSFYFTLPLANEKAASV